MQNDLGLVWRKLELLAAFSADERVTVTAMFGDVRAFERSRIIAKHGTENGKAFVLLSGIAGRATMHGGSRRIIELLLPGDLSDLYADVGPERMFDLVALGSVQAAVIERRGAERLGRNVPSFSSALHRSLMVDHAIMRQSLITSSHGADSAIAHLFCDLYVRLGLIGEASDGVLDVPLTQGDIGDTLGLTAVHVNRMTQRLKADGLIARARNWQLIDLPALRDLANFNPDWLRLVGQEDELVR